MTELTIQRRSPQVRILAAAFFLLLSLVLLELVCQVYARAVVFPHFESTRENPRHYYRSSANPTLGYELLPGFDLTRHGKTIHINRYGLRDSSDDLAEGARRIALLGDSVAFGLSHTQDMTIAERVQRIMDPARSETKMLNLGVGGYAFPQVLESLKLKNEIYSFTDAVYLLNLNDYSRRNSIYEGADNGLFRTYHQPQFMVPWFVRKAVYRHKKHNRWGGPEWYRWMFEGNEQRGYDYLQQMIDYSKRRGIGFSVFILPAGSSYREGGYELADINQHLIDFLAESGIPAISPVEEFSHDSEHLIDETDHLHERGTELMAELLVDFIRDVDEARAASLRPSI